MSTIARLGLMSVVKHSMALRQGPRSCVALSVRNCGLVRDWKPAPYPKTKEERIAAAAKYNLIPEDYEPYEEGSGFGDYPKMPIVCQDACDPYQDYDYYYRRRNYGETVHVDYDIHTSEKTNLNYKYRFSPLFMFCVFVGSYALFGLFGWIDWYFDLHTAQPMKEKQLWSPGVVHYSFEPLD